MSRSFLSTAEHRRELVIASAVHVFAERGFLGTPIAAVAEHAGISPAYVFKLFPGKTALFVAALEECYDRMEAALEAGAQRATGTSPEDVLDAMGGAYADLIADRDLLTLQVHALSAADDPAIADAVRGGTARTVRCAQALSRASDAEVQRFLAWGQLCHLVVTLDLADTAHGPGPEEAHDWAGVLSHGLRHPGPAAASPRRTAGGEAD